MLTVNIIGTERIQTHIRNKTDRKKINDALDKVALMIERDAKDMSPVKTGRLRNSIDTKTPSEFTRSIGTSVEYAPYQEFGTQRMQPQPFLRPALMKNKYKLAIMLKGNE